MRLQPEVRAAFPSSIGARLHFMAYHGWRIVTAPMSPKPMARRVSWASAIGSPSLARVQRRRW
jgi:hypothetical protein